MKYMLLIQYGDAPTPSSRERWERLPEHERRAIYGAYEAINETPGVSPGLRLQPPEAATTVWVENGNTMTAERPFVATDKALGGYLLFEADDLDAAFELASRIPAARMGGAVEVRPVVEPSEG